MVLAARTHNPFLRLAALLERDLAADLAEAQGAKQATKVAAEVVARHMDKRSGLLQRCEATFTLRNPHPPGLEMRWRGQQIHM